MCLESHEIFSGSGNTRNTGSGSPGNSETCTTGHMRPRLWEGPAGTRCVVLYPNYYTPRPSGNKLGYDCALSKDMFTVIPKRTNNRYNRFGFPTKMGMRKLLIIPARHSAECFGMFCCYVICLFPNNSETFSIM